MATRILAGTGQGRVENEDRKGTRAGEEVRGVMDFRSQWG